MKATSQSGFSLIDVMMAMTVLAFGILGVMSAFQWSEYGLRQGTAGTRALAMAESRLEAKRAAPWDALLSDDLDGDGRPDVFMRDDGQWPDRQGGDGLYTATVDRDGILLEWTVRADRAGPAQSWGSAVIVARARYPVGRGQWQEIRVGTLLGNPSYVGAR